MKRLYTILTLAILLGACAPINNLYFTDYRPYVEKGFFISSSSSINYKHIPLGEIAIEKHLQVIKKEFEKKTTTNHKKKYDPIYGENMGSFKKKYNPFPGFSEYLLDLIYNNCKKVGANGVIGLKVYVDKALVYHVSGTAIKIVDKEYSKTN